MSRDADHADRTVHDRRIWISGLLCAAQGQGGIEGRTRIHKYVFLCQERSGLSSYTFDAKEFGPYSRGLQMDFDELVAHGFVGESQEFNEAGQIMYVYEATDEMRMFLADTHDDHQGILIQAAVILNKYGEKPLPELLAELYREYPEYARNARPLP